jgi:predicted GNAT family N-acyltransferase
LPAHAEIKYQIEPLGSNHDRVGFSCGVESLDRYLQKQARQDSDRKLASIFVLTSDGSTIAGFYSLSAQTIMADELSAALARKLPHFPLPATLLGRMAVSQTLRGQRLGEFLLMDALRRAWLATQQVASWAVIVDAKQGAREFYIRYGFIAAAQCPDRLFYPMASIAKLFQNSA